MKIFIKTFEALTKEELYAILRLRSEVFVVEQDCVYQDIDNKDFNALHLIGNVNEQLVAYTRIFDEGQYFDKSSIGRVVVSPTARGKNFGKQIMEASIGAIKDYFGPKDIHISAQSYLLKFYQELGFSPIGEEYLEDGIPHTGMMYYFS
jgi:ElaA protein